MFPYMFLFHKNELPFSPFLHHTHTEPRLILERNKHVELLLQMKMVPFKATCDSLFWATLYKALVRKSAPHSQATWINKITIILCKQLLTTQMGKK